MSEEQEFQQKVRRVEALVREIETAADPGARAKMVELVQSLMDFHGAGLERLMELIAEEGEAGHRVFGRLAGDPLVSSLLLLYNLHPHDLETRVARALETVRPYLRSHGGDVELVGVEGDAVRLRMQGSGHGCPSSAATLRLALEEAIYEAAPDVAAIEVTGAVEQPRTAGLVQLVGLSRPRASAQPHDGNGRGDDLTS